MTKKRTLYEIVDELCSRGKYVVITTGQVYAIVAPFKNDNGDWLCSAYKADLAECIENVCCNYIYKYEFEKEPWKYHSLYTPPIKQYEVGEKVVNCRGEVCELAAIWSEEGLLEESNGEILAASAVTPYIPEIHDKKEEEERWKYDGVPVTEDSITQLLNDEHGWTLSRS
jgi:hypothetical protein